MTFSILFAASTVTYVILILATPITYTALVTDHFLDQAAALPGALEETTLEDSGPVLDQFILDTGASLMILDEGGKIVNTPSNLSIHVAYEDEDMVLSVTPASEEPEGKNVSVYTETSEGGEEPLQEISVTTSGLDYSFSFLGQSAVYTLYISPPVEKANLAVQAIGRVAPWLLGSMVVFSLLCALVYSRYITRPILRLSGISQRMAALDFSQHCGETRADEIGALGRNLDILSARLSAALQELRQANAALRQDIHRERELERQRMAFFSAASHELKTPLTILKGQLGGMLDGIDVYRDRDKYLRKALGVAEGMESLVGELLTVSRVESGAFAHRRQRVDLIPLLHRQLALVEDLLAEKSLRTELTLEEAPLSGDPALLEKVLGNLISNAVFYAPPGALLTVTLAAHDGGALFSLENSGSHIPQEALPHVFEAFFRADPSRNRRTGGSGLGLFLVKQILELHQAPHRIENTRDGVRFTIWFPPPSHEPSSPQGPAFLP